MTQMSIGLLFKNFERGRYSLITKSFSLCHNNCQNLHGVVGPVLGAPGGAFSTSCGRAPKKKIYATSYNTNIPTSRSLHVWFSWLL